MEEFIRRVMDAFLQGVEDVVAALCKGMSAPEADKARMKQAEHCIFPARQ
jgi:hypothetical protein